MTNAPAGRLVEQFAAALAAVGGTYTIVTTEQHAIDAVCRVLEMVLPADDLAVHVGTSDAPLCRAIAMQLASSPSARAIHVIPAEQCVGRTLFELDAGVTSVQWGIAETGTLVLQTGRERNRLLSLVPPVHVAVLHVSTLLPTGAAVLAAVHEQTRAGSNRSHALTFITGPSRTSDIELIPVIGVHGPRQLHVVIVGDDLHDDDHDVLLPVHLE